MDAALLFALLFAVVVLIAPFSVALASRSAGGRNPNAGALEVVNLKCVLQSGTAMQALSSCYDCLLTFLVPVHLCQEGGLANVER